jgi:formylglycine-generating enzyme required for sulfatase activity
MIDLNKNNRIDAEEYKLVTELFFADGYTFTEDGTPEPIEKDFEYQESEIMLPGDIPLVLVRIPSGVYKMGEWTLNSYLKRIELEKVDVVISEDFYLGKFEVTQQQYEAVTGENPSSSKGSKYPVHTMGWEGANKFIDGLNQLFPEGGFRVPTSAEWEYAARAGTTSTYYWGESLGEGENYEWIDSNSQYTPFPVGLLEPNPWGLYDMQGNVSEMVRDSVIPDYLTDELALISGTLLIDPVGMLSGDFAYTRGGNIHSPSDYYQTYSDSGYIRRGALLRTEGLYGFRVVRDIKEDSGTNINLWSIYE